MEPDALVAAVGIERLHRIAEGRGEALRGGSHAGRVGVGAEEQAGGREQKGGGLHEGLQTHGGEGARS